MIELKISEILDIIQGKLIQGSKELVIKSISTDTRENCKDCLFIPLIGDKYDGHNFIYQAFINGAVATLSLKDRVPIVISQLNKIGLKQTNFLLPIIIVSDVLKSYQTLANYVRKKLNTNIIAITGSSGKTSTKEYVYTLFNNFYPTLKTESNFNNEIGVPKTLLNLKYDHKFGVIEMAMRAKNEIKELCNIAEPDIGIITNIGSAHIGLLGSKEEILNAKWELADYLKEKNGYLVLNGDDEMLLNKSNEYPIDKLYFTSLDRNNEKANLVMLEKYLLDGYQYFTCIYKPLNKQYTVKLKSLGDHQISNALEAIMVGLHYNLPLNNTIDLTTSPIFGRNEIINIKGITFINDAYNANPESMQASLKTFVETVKGRKIVILGGMKELGEYSDSYHYKLGEYCASLPIDLLCVVGKEALRILEGAVKSKFPIDNILSFSDNSTAAEELINILKDGDNVLLKGSRAFKLEEIIDIIKTSFGEGVVESN